MKHGMPNWRGRRCVGVFRWEVLRSISEQPLSVGVSEFPIPGIESLGVLSRQQVQKILRDGVDSVVRPAFDSLLGV